MTAATITGADAVAAALRDAGVDVVFGLPGVHNLALWPALSAAGIRIVGSRHEQGCAYAADGYARATRRVGVALVTTGPGAANTLGAVGEAWASHSPVLVIATEVDSTMRRPGVYRGILHESTDQREMFATLTKARMTVENATLLRGWVRHACEVAATAPAGPVYVGIATDFLTAVVPEGEPTNYGGVPGTEDLDGVLEAIARSERPIVWAGRGAASAADAVDALARALGAPVITTYGARGILPRDHPMLVTAPPHEPEVTALIASADLAIVIGSDLDHMNTMAWKLPLPDARIAINVDAEDARKNYPMDVVIEADAATAGEIAKAVIARGPWTPDVRAIGDAVRNRLRDDEETASAVEFLERTEAALPGDAVVFADMCIPGYWLAGHLRVGAGGGLHYPMGWGTLGFAFPAAIGAAAAEKLDATSDASRPVVAVVGDGGMLFAVGELATAVQERLALTVVVVDDDGYGMLRYGRESQSAAYGCDLSPVDFSQVAAGFGLTAHTLDGFGAEYEDALATAVAAAEPRLLHVHARLTPPVTTSPRWPLR